MNAKCVDLNPQVKIIAFTSAICLYLYAGVAIVYGTLRLPIITHVPYSIFLCIAWNGLGIVASMLVTFAVILKYWLFHFHQRMLK